MKKFVLVIILCCSLLAASSCGNPAGSSSGEDLAIGILPDVDSIPLIIAGQQGYFEEEGIKVRLESFKSAMDRDSALQSKNIDGAVSDILAAAFAKEGGFEVRITSKTNGSYKLLANKASDIHRLEDIRGKNVAISKNTIIEFSTDMLLKVENVKPEDINKTVVKDIPARLEMLKNGKVDAATLPEPLASVAIKDGAKIISSSDKLGLNPGVLLFTSKAIRDKSNQISSFYRAYNKAVRYLQQEASDKYMDMLIKNSGFPEAVKGTLLLPQYEEAVQVGEEDLDKVVKWLMEKQLIKKNYEFKDLTDDKFTR